MIRISVAIHKKILILILHLLTHDILDIDMVPILQLWPLFVKSKLYWKPLEVFFTINPTVQFPHDNSPIVKFELVVKINSERLYSMVFKHLMLTNEGHYFLWICRLPVHCNGFPIKVFKDIGCNNWITYRIKQHRDYIDMT